MNQRVGERPIVEIVEQHAEEAAFLWLLRESAVCAPHFGLADLGRLDGRLEAHLDGLRVAGDFGWEVARQGLAVGQPGEVFTAAVLAFEGLDLAARDEVWTQAFAEPSLARALVAALAWLPYPQAEGPIQTLLQSDSPAGRWIGIAATAAHRRLPPGGLFSALNDVDLRVRARALRAAGELGEAALRSLLRKHLKAADPGCRFWAAWSSARLADDPEAVAVLQTFTSPESPFAERAVDLVARRLPLAAAKRWQAALAQDPALARLAVIAAGAVGLPDLVPWIVDQMETPALARVAGEAFSVITGANIAYDKLEGAGPEGFASGPTEAADDEVVALDVDEHLAWPNQPAVRRWWEARAGAFPAGTRHLLGRPIEAESLLRALRSGRQRQRAAAALELALRQPSRPLFEVRALGVRQGEALGLTR